MGDVWEVRHAGGGPGSLTGRAIETKNGGMGRLDGKVAIVTGASRGIGKAISQTFARQGACIVVAAKTAEPHPKLPGTIHDTVEEIKQAGGKALAVQVNVREDAAIDSMVQQTLDAFGRIDILINNAGAIFIADAEATTAKKFDLVMDVNARAAFLCSRAAIPHMKQGGHIVMMSPPIAPRALKGKVAYGLSKVGMSMVAIGLAEELRHRNISVNALWPVTAVESQATIQFEMGSKEDWRTPAVLADATLELVCTPPGEKTGLTLYDEEVLGWAGITDLERYSVVPGAKPAPWSKSLFDDESKS
ncbi:MAG: SDR family oxidoreductase [Myxococcota bacterium]